MYKLTKNQRIAKLEDQVSELQKILSVTDKSLPVLKNLDQSVFNGLDKQWQWAAVDEDNECFLYVDKPVINASISFFYSQDDELKVGDDYDSTNWQNSLIKREAETELTGSDLCKALLGHGHQYIVCFVSEISDKHAINGEHVEVIISRGSDYFDDSNEDMWGYAVPINSQGIPLTANEVGL